MIASAMSLLRVLVAARIFTVAISNGECEDDTSLLTLHRKKAPCNFNFLQDTQRRWSNGEPILITTWGGMDGPIDETYFNTTMTWESAKNYFFVKEVSGKCDPKNINLDSLCSEIAYISMLRKDMFSTWFSNDGYYGHTGRPMLVMRRDSWDTSAAERLNIKQGWFIDSWPDYRFASDADPPSNYDRFYQLNYGPSGYKTVMNVDYCVNVSLFGPDQVEIFQNTTLPDYVIGTIIENPSLLSAGAPGPPPPPPPITTWFDMGMYKEAATSEAFVDYYAKKMNKAIGGFEDFIDGGKRLGNGSNAAKNINFFQGFVDFETWGLAYGMDQVANFRNLYFEQRLYSNAAAGPPFGNEVEFDAFPWKKDPANPKDGEDFVAYQIPYSAPGAVALCHEGAKWSFSSRPQPPHDSSVRKAWSFDPEYWYLYKATLFLRENIIRELREGGYTHGDPMLIEVMHLNGTNYGGEELNRNIEGWISRSRDFEGTEIFSEWIDLYGNETGPQFKVFETGTAPASAQQGVYYKIKNVKDLDASNLQVSSGFGVWAIAEDGSYGSVMKGSSGDDDLYGNDGDNTLVAYAAVDRLTGGKGMDSFILEEACVECVRTKAIVMDLEVGEIVTIKSCSAASLTLEFMYWPGVLPPAKTTINLYKTEGYISVQLNGVEIAQIWRALVSDLTSSSASGNCEIRRLSMDKQDVEPMPFHDYPYHPHPHP